MGVWKGVAMDFLKFHSGLPCPNFLQCRIYTLQMGYPWNGLTAISGMARLQGSCLQSSTTHFDNPLHNVESWIFRMDRSSNHPMAIHITYEKNELSTII
jgi:hypothetical protein